jgi:general secretion pathway protein J
MRREDGFTLVEMLVSLIIVGFLAAMMLQGLYAGRKAWERADAGNIAGESVSGAQMLVRARLERAFPATRYDKIPTYADFAGAADSVNFLAPPRDIQAPQALIRYVLGLATNGDLTLAYLSDVSATPQGPGTGLILLHGVQQLDIGYYGVLPPDKAPAWHDTWQGRAVLPLLMRIRVQFPPDDPRIWPDLFVKPFAMVDSMCVLTVMTGKCRGRQ